MELSSNEMARYARQMRLPQFGLAGQQRLKDAAVLIVGAGGLGSPAAMYLAAAGVGRIGIADGDRVDPSNLHRQLLHHDADVGRAKVQSARATLETVNPHVRIDAIDERVTSANALDLVAAYDVVIDGTDNFPTRYLLNDACVLSGRPLVYGSVDRFEGQVSVLAADRGPCYRCLYPNAPEPGTVQNCADAGVLGILPGLIGTLQGIEAIKLILGRGTSLVGRLLLVDTLSMRFREIAVERDATCPACGTREIDRLMDHDALCNRSESDDRAEPGALDEAASEPVSASVGEIVPTDLARELERSDAPILIDVREPFEWQIARIPSAQLIPLRSLMTSIPDISADADIVVYCHHGGRSEAAANALLARGFRRVRNLVGGIDRWSIDVDPTVARY